MGLRSIRMPDVGEGVAEAEMVEWHVKVGDLVREDQVVAAVMTDKATVEIPTPVAGSVVALGGAVGDVLAVGAELIRIDAPGLPDSPPPPPPKGIAKTAAAAGARGRAPSGRARSVDLPAGRRRAAGRREGEAGAAATARLRPRRRAARRGRPARSRSPRPPCASGRARPASTCASCTAQARRGASAMTISTPSSPTRPTRRREAPGDSPNLAVETVKIVGMRRRIAQNMAESSRRVAHFSYVEEVDATALEELRAALNTRATEDRPTADGPAVPDARNRQGGRRLTGDQRALRRRQRPLNHLRRRASRHCDPDAGRTDGSGGPPRRDARPIRGGAARCAG